MRRFIWILLLMLIGSLLPLQAQDALNLPSELYLLTNEGHVQRFGLGSEGVSTVTPENDFVLDFRVSPDANWFAYRTPDGLFMRNIFDADMDSFQIEDNRASIPLLRGRGETIAWASDSSAIAYTTEYGGRVHFFRENVFADLTTPNLTNLLWSSDGRFLAAETDENIWWVFQRNGATMELRAAIPGANGADWFSNNQLLYAPLEGGIVVLDLSAGNQQIEILNNSAVYFNPSVTRDGQVVAFTGAPNSANLVQIDIDEGFVGVATVIGSNTVDLTGASWSPGGFLLTVFQGGVIALVNPITANGFTLPVSSVATYSWGPEYPQLTINQILPRNAHFNANDSDGVRQVYVLPADGTRARTITAATLDISEFAISPDAQQIVYVSNSILWLYPLGSDSDPVELVTLGININVAPAWSPDNTTIYYRDEQGDESGIWRISADTSPELFLADDENAIFKDPNPAMGVAAMLVKHSDELAIVDTNSSEVTLLGIIGNATWQSGTQFIVEGQSQDETISANGLYLGDANTLELAPTLILPLLGSFELFDYRVLDGVTLRMLVKNQVPGDVRILDVPLVGGQAVLMGSAGNMVNPRLSVDGKLVIGQRSPEGALLIYDLQTNTTHQLDIQPPIIHFVWQ